MLALLLLALLSAAQADGAYVVDDTNPSIVYVGKWHSENDYDSTSSYNGTMSNALQQDDTTTASLIFFGSSIIVYGQPRFGTQDSINWGANGTVDFWLDGQKTFYNASANGFKRANGRSLTQANDSQYLGHSLVLRAGPGQSDWLFFESGPIPLTKHLLLVANAGSFIYLDAFYINSTVYPVSIQPPSQTSSGIPTIPSPSTQAATTSPPSSSSGANSQGSSLSSQSRETSPSEGMSSHSKNTGAVIGGILAGVAIPILFLASFLIWRWRQKARSKQATLDHDPFAGGVVPVNPYQDHIGNMTEWRAEQLVGSGHIAQEPVPGHGIPAPVLGRSPSANTEEQGPPRVAQENDERILDDEALDGPALSEYQTVLSSLPPPYTTY